MLCNKELWFPSVYKPSSLILYSASTWVLVSSRPSSWSKMASLTVDSSSEGENQSKSAQKQEFLEALPPLDVSRVWDHCIPTLHEPNDDLERDLDIVHVLQLRQVWTLRDLTFLSTSVRAAIKRKKSKDFTCKHDDTVIRRLRAFLKKVKKPANEVFQSLFSDGKNEPQVYSCPLTQLAASQNEKAREIYDKYIALLGALSFCNKFKRVIIHQRSHGYKFWPKQRRFGSFLYQHRKQRCIE